MDDRDFWAEVAASDRWMLEHQRRLLAEDEDRRRHYARLVRLFHGTGISVSELSIMQPWELDDIEAAIGETQTEAASPPLRVGDPAAVVVATDSDEQTETPDDECVKYERLRSLTPELDIESMDWAPSKDGIQKIFGIDRETLTKYRDRSHRKYESADKLFGVDQDDRIYRRNPTNNRVYYFVRDIEKA